jgi:hypothetical protein
MVLPSCGASSSQLTHLATQESRERMAALNGMLRQQQLTFTPMYLFQHAEADKHAQCIVQLYAAVLR